MIALFAKRSATQVVLAVALLFATTRELSATAIDWSSLKDAQAAGITRVQDKSASAVYNNAVTITFNNPTASGNTLVVAVSNYYSSSPPSSISDSFGNTWSTAVNYASGSRIVVFYASDIVGGSNHQLTVSASGPDYYVVTAIEYSGLLGTNVVDVTAGGRTAANIYSSGAVNISHPEELLLGVHHVWNPTASLLPDAPWSTVASSSDNVYHQHHVQDRIVSSGGSYASTGTIADWLDTQSVIVAFKGLSAGVPAPTISAFSANSTTLQKGESTSLSWSTDGATTVTIAPVGQVASSGTIVVNPSTTTIYTLTATNSGGSVSASSTVTVGDVGTGEGSWIAICSGNPSNCPPGESYPYFATFNYAMPYAASRGTLLYWGMYNNPETIFSNAMWEYHVSTHSFNRLSWTGSSTYETCEQPFPPYQDGHAMSYFQYDSRRDKVFITALLCSNYLLHHTWTMDATTLAWSELLNGGNPVYPGDLVDAAFVYDPVHDTYIAYGTNNTLLHFDPRNNIWVDDTNRQTGDIPMQGPSYGLGKLLFNTADRNVYFFGGLSTADAQGAQNDLYRFDPEILKWTRINPAGDVKPPKEASLYPWLIYDTVRNRLVQYVDVGNMWQYSFATNTWTQLNIAGGPSIPRDSVGERQYFSGLAGYDPEQDTMVIMELGANDNNINASTDVWELSFKSSTTVMPAIDSFTAQPASIVAGQTSTLSWNVSNAGTVSIDQGIGAVTGNTLTLSPASTTTYTLTAANGNGSATRAVTLSVSPDTTVPSIPLNLTATSISRSQINLSWTASADNVGVAGYKIERCQSSNCTNFVQIATTSATSYPSTGLKANVAYRYRVRAYDAAGNNSGYSVIATATTKKR